TLPLGTPLAEADLLDGDELVLVREAPPAEREPAAALELVVVGGPDAGRRFPLPAGERFVGRDPACEVAVDDPALSARHVRLVVGAGGAVVADAGSRNGTAVEGESLAAGAELPLAPGAWVQAGRTI